MVVLVISTVLAVAAIAFLIFALLYSRARPESRLWPPKDRSLWRFLVVWVPMIAAFGALIAIGVLDWNSVGLSAWLRWPLGGGLLLVSNAVVWAHVAAMGATETSGAKGRLKTDGLNRFTRNPQYLSDIVMLIGWLVLSGSIWLAAPTVIAVIAFLLAPLAEEPWLEDVYGDAYRRYRERTPRFLFI